jgi:hypothetical protein
MRIATIDSPSFGFRLVSSNGDTLGTVETVDPDFQVGDTVVLDGVGYSVRLVIPIDRIAQFIEAPLHGVLQVDPI